MTDPIQSITIDIESLEKNHVFTIPADATSVKLRFGAGSGRHKRALESCEAVLAETQRERDDLKQQVRDLADERDEWRKKAVRDLPDTLHVNAPCSSDPLFIEPKVTWESYIPPRPSANADADADSAQRIARAFGEKLNASSPDRKGAQILDLIDTIKETGGTVEIHGVKIQRCDERGQTY